MTLLDYQALIEGVKKLEQLAGFEEKHWLVNQKPQLTQAEAMAVLNHIDSIKHADADSE